MFTRLNKIRMEKYDKDRRYISVMVDDEGRIQRAIMLADIPCMNESETHVKPSGKRVRVLHKGDGDTQTTPRVSNDNTESSVTRTRIVAQQTDTDNAEECSDEVDWGSLMGVGEKSWHGGGGRK